MSDGTFESAAIGLAVALGCGMLIGLERERRKGSGATREPAGIRSFMLASLTGALAQSVRQPGVVIAGAVLIGALALLAYWKSRSDDPGLTTELALFATYLIGVASVFSPALGAACGATVAALLASREQLHRLSTQLLSERELKDLILLAGLALVVLPLVPSGAQPWSGGIDPRRLASLVVLILVLQAAGHVATRWLGPRAGLAASGFFSGFVSSTATIASMGSRLRGAADQLRTHAGAGVMSSAATWVQAWLLASSLAPAAAGLLLPIAAAGALVALALGGALAWHAPGSGSSDAGPQDSALRLREAFVVAALLSGVAALVSWAQGAYGHVGLYTSVALASTADAHAPVASGAALFAAGRLDDVGLVRCVLLAIGVNTVTRTIVAVASGGRAYGAVVGLCLVIGTSTAALVAWFTGHL